MKKVHRPSNGRLSSAALALAALLCGTAVPALAQSSVQLYGLIDANVGQFQNAGGVKIKRLDSGDLSTSYFGFKGREDLGGGLAASFTLESFFQVDNGGASRVPGVDTFWARNANVALSGGFGTVRLGRQGVPMFVTTLLFNAIGDSFGFSPAIRQWWSAPYGTPSVGDTGWSNAIGYSSPSLGGLGINLVVAAGEGAATARGPNKGLNLLYFSGPLAASVAWQKVEAQGVLGRGIAAFPGYSSQTAWQTAGSYKVGDVKLFALYGRIRTDATADVTTTNTNLGLSWALGAGSLVAQYGTSRIETQGVSLRPRSKMLTAGYLYNLSKRTELYAMTMRDQYTGLSTGTSLAAGVRHTF